MPLNYTIMFSQLASCRLTQVGRVTVLSNPQSGPVGFIALGHASVHVALVGECNHGSNKGSASSHTIASCSYGCRLRLAMECS